MSLFSMEKSSEVYSITGGTMTFTRQAKEARIVQIDLLKIKDRNY